MCFLLRFSGRQWLTVHNGGGNWSLYLNASLTKRSDTNKVNRTPISVMQPIQRVLYRCSQNITIPGIYLYSLAIFIFPSMLIRKKGRLTRLNFNTHSKTGNYLSTKTQKGQTQPDIRTDKTMNT